MDVSSTGTVIDALPLSHGFRPTPDGPIGVRHDLPLRVASERAPQRNNSKVLRLTIGTSGPETADAAVAAVRAQKKQLPAKLLGADAVPGGIVVDLPNKLASAPADQALAAIDAVLEAVGSVPGVAPSAAPDAQLTTVDGVPLLLTTAEREQLSADAEAAAQAYAAIRPNLVGGLLAGAVGAVVLAAVWAGLLAYANYQFWLVAIGGGLLVAFLAVFVGRRVTVPLQIGIFVLTVGGVLLGEILGLALWIQSEAGFFDLALAFELYAEYFGEEPGDAMFALGGGLVGAFFGIRSASKPRFDRQIDVH